MSQDNLEKLEHLSNPHLEEILEDVVTLMKPKEVFIVSDSKEDIETIRVLSQVLGEEFPLTDDHPMFPGGIHPRESSKLHKVVSEVDEFIVPDTRRTIHYDGWISNSNHDQARDPEHTATLLPPDVPRRKNLSVEERDEGLKEVRGLMEGVMEGKTMFVRLFCLGPNRSDFSQYALQITDSAYVSHSEDLLYRPGFEDFAELSEDDHFFTVIHSAGQLTEHGHSKNLDQRRIYIDPIDSRVYSINNQYAGNSLGLKKLSLRLAIWKSNIEKDWLAEHMFISGFEHDGKMTYFAGAFPSACGKTSTAMLDGSSVIGDDIAYLKRGNDGELRGVNIELGCFGIIKDVNPVDDPIIYNTIMNPDNEIIFSNILTLEDKTLAWLGMYPENSIESYPTEGYNHSGEWTLGKTDENDSSIDISHKNARFTCRISDFDNADPNLNSKEGVEISAILYGGRDSDTCVPFMEAHDWNGGVFLGATIESETTTATLGTAGVKKCSPFANMDFMIVPTGEYIKNHIEYGKTLTSPPRVYQTNYFLLDEDGKQLNPKDNTIIWIKWANARIHGEDYATVIETPFGKIPTLESLQKVFMDVLGREYTREQYIAQFSLRPKKYLEKLLRIEEFYFGDETVPQEFWDIWEEQAIACCELISKNKSFSGHVSPYDI